MEKLAQPNNLDEKVDRGMLEGEGPSKMLSNSILIIFCKITFKDFIFVSNQLFKTNRYTDLQWNWDESKVSYWNQSDFTHIS